MTHERGGWRSTKLHLTLIAMALITGAFVFIDRAHRGTAFAEYTIAIGLCLGTFCGSNVWEKRRGVPPSADPKGGA